jgi:dihydrodipicolinate synthase/N-acetylneuraminate lyase
MRSLQVGVFVRQLIAVAPPSSPGDFSAALEYWTKIGAASPLPFYVYWIAATADRSITPEKVCGICHARRF